MSLIIVNNEMWKFNRSTESKRLNKIKKKKQKKVTSLKWLVPSFLLTISYKYFDL